MGVDGFSRQFKECLTASRAWFVMGCASDTARVFTGFSWGNTRVNAEAFPSSKRLNLLKFEEI
ncbi:hypothetical protein KS4_35740 [Poriferisphaera corsica]|uniref:Uncharacterized protein n=1 Tax=Poriferisphaera corsica TaxID=2528020 RepID=A0A517YZ35_9BACT|nr:hypothetical protein KS4_35740 [Poriferisphaera corsica]